VTKAIEVAQKRVEQHNFDIRKHVLEYDNVMNKQREVIYDERKKILMGDDVKGHIYEIIAELIDGAIELYLNPDVQKLDWKYAEFREWFWSKFNIRLQNIEDMVEGKDRDGILEELVRIVKSSYEEKEKRMGPGLLRHMEKMIMLQVIDTKWKDHLHAMDNLREGIGLRAYGQRDPLVEYQHEGYDMFRGMIGSVKDDTIEFLFKVEAVREEGKVKGVFQSLSQEFLHTEATPMSRIPTPSAGEPSLEKDLPQQDEPQQHKREEPKVGRNDPCPCASGKKYKKCCGR